jgi:microcystin-dependent protein
MASTFSPSLKLELIGNGDQSGTWGTTTNNNLGTLIEQAIAGVRQIVMTNIDYTLSSLNGISDESRNAVIVLSGTNSAIRNIIAPTAEKTYIIKNATSGGFAIIVKTSASTGVSIANGATQTIFCDGTEFYVASFPSTGGTITGNLAITGTLNVGGIPTIPTAAPGTSTTQAATTAFTTAAIATAVAASLQLIYPIGCIYTTTVATNPNSIFGFGTWVAIGQGQVLIGAGGGYTAGTSGGSATTTLAITNLPAHSHTATDAGHTHPYNTKAADYVQSGNSTPCWSGNATGTTNTGYANISIGNTGSGTAFSIVQPYLVVYMWNRTA